MKVIGVVIMEIIKMEPNFDPTEFLKHVESVMIPNILESISREDLDILEDWCTYTVCLFI